MEGKPLATVLKDRFFAPLGMTHTALDDEQDIVPGRVAGYDAEAPGKFKNARFISMTIPGAAGAMRSSASDLARWNSALFGGKVLKPASFQAMITPGRLDNGQLSSTAMPKTEGAEPGEYGYALGISKVEGHTRIGHGGGIFGFNTSLQEFPDDHVTVAVIANGIGKDVGVGQNRASGSSASCSGCRRNDGGSKANEPFHARRGAFRRLPLPVGSHCPQGRPTTLRPRRSSRN